MTLIWIGLGVLIFLSVLKKVYRSYWKEGLSAKIYLSSEESYQGDQVELIEEIDNRKWLPLLMIKVKFSIHKNLKFSDVVENVSVTDKNYKQDVFSLLFFQRIVRRIPFTCNQRGYYYFDQVDVYSSDFFLEQVLATKYPIHKSLTVLPQTVDVYQLEVLLRRIVGETVTRKYLMEDPFTFAGIREYQPSDTMQDINWKASAKTGDLKVNVHESTTGQEVRILLNLETEGILNYPALQECSISIACSLAHRLTEQGIAVGVYSNAIDALTNQEILIESGTDAGHRNNILYALSRIALEKDMCDFARFIKEHRMDQKSGALPVLISTSRKKDLQDVFLTMTECGKEGLWVYPYHPDMEPTVDAVPQDCVLGWRTNT